MFTRSTTYPLLLFITIIAFSCSASRVDQFSPADKLPPDKLRDDAVLLKKILEANHPSLYWYTPKDSIDLFFNNTINSIQDSLTELQFRKKIAKAVAQIHCGHTAVRSSGAYSRYYSNHRPVQFPLVIKAWGYDSMVVITNFIKADTALKRGTIVTSINGMPNRQVLDSMFQYISMDGYSDNFKYQLVSIYFPLFYNMAIGLQGLNIITYKDAAGLDKADTLQNFFPIRDTSKLRVANTLSPRPTRKQLRQLRMRDNNNITFDSSNTAHISLVTFSGGGLRGFFKDCFEQIQARNTQNLIIDLRENGGGNIAASANLTRYLINHPFTVADTVEAISRSFKYGRYIHPGWLYKVLMAFSSKKESDGLYHFRYFERHLYNPMAQLHFDGHIYIIQGGLTFSAASMFVGHLKGQQNVTVVGEESGGGSYGNSSVHLPSIVLPNSHIEIILPIYRIVNSRVNPKTGRGIIPDIFISPSSNAIKKGIDLKLKKINELIQNGKT